MKTEMLTYLLNFQRMLVEEEKSPNTVEKYVRDVQSFLDWLGNREISKTVVLEYKRTLVEKYATTSVNSAISALNSFFAHVGKMELKVKILKKQQRIFLPKERQMTKAEYERLLSVASLRRDQKLYLLIQTICSTGIRVSELKFITVSAVKTGEAEINSKGKIRTAFLPNELCKKLSLYQEKNKIKSGPVFVSKNGNPLNRSNIWSSMKGLCNEARVPKEKVFPHNLRHLFARTYYSMKKDIVRLADILGHGSINTTRIYTMESGETHKKQIQSLGLIDSSTT